MVASGCLMVTIAEGTNPVDVPRIPRTTNVICPSKHRWIRPVNSWVESQRDAGPWFVEICKFKPAARRMKWERSQLGWRGLQQKNLIVGVNEELKPILVQGLGLQCPDVLLDQFLSHSFGIGQESDTWENKLAMNKNECWTIHHSLQCQSQTSSSLGYFAAAPLHTKDLL